MNTTLRTGTITVMLAIILPVIFILCAMAINLAQVQLARTELKIATDAATRAGGRAWAYHNDKDQVIAFAKEGAAANTILNQSIQLVDDEIQFGTTTRLGTAGRYEFTATDADDTDFATAIRVTATVNNNLAFRVAGIDTVQQTTSTVTSQVNRDIALIVDRSESMAFFKDETLLYNEITSLYDNGHGVITEQEYLDALAASELLQELDDISFSRREYSENVLNLLSGDLLEYAVSINDDYPNAAPSQSRWTVLEQATEVFFETLSNSSVSERVSVSSFATSPTLDLPLSFDLDLAHEKVLELIPMASTAIGQGMQIAIPDLIGEGRRSNAVPTLLIFSDGQNLQDPSPIDVATQIMADHPEVVINTITFADVDPSEMAQVARIGNGIHYHANDTAQLVNVFEEIGKSFSTVITE